jgi:hypothetical protein
MMRGVFANHTSEPLPDEPPLLPREAYGTLAMQQYAPLLPNVKVLSPK